MSRTVLIILAIVAVASGWYVMQNYSADDAADDAGATMEDAVEGAEEAAEEAGDAVEGAVEAVEEAAEEAVEAVEGAVDAASDAVDEAAEEAEEMVDEATEEAEAMADEAAEETEAMADEATEEAEAMADEATEGTEAMADTGDLSELLTVDGFDADALIAAVENSDLPATTQTTLTAAIEGARGNPELVEGVVSQVREALGL